MSWLRKRWLLGFGLAILLMAGCQDRGRDRGAEIKRQVVTGLQTAEVRLNPLTEYHETTATVRPQAVSVIASKVMGVVTAIHVKEGEGVAAGQELLTIDDRELVQRLKAADADRQEARKALDAAVQNRSLASVTQRRYKHLFDERAISVVAGWNRKYHNADMRALGDALAAAVYLHGRAGDIAAIEMGEEPLTATDLIGAFPAAFRSVHPGQTAARTGLFYEAELEVGREIDHE